MLIQVLRAYGLRKKQAAQPRWHNTNAVDEQVVSKVNWGLTQVQYYSPDDIYYTPNNTKTFFLDQSFDPTVEITTETRTQVENDKVEHVLEHVLKQFSELLFEPSPNKI